MRHFINIISEEASPEAIPTLWYHSTAADLQTVADDFENNNLDPTGAAPSWQYWFSDSWEASRYYGPNAVEAKLLFNNPLLVTEEMREERKASGASIGTVGWANEAYRDGYDAVIIFDIMDGDMFSTVCAVFDEGDIRAHAYSRYDEETDSTIML